MSGENPSEDSTTEKKRRALSGFAGALAATIVTLGATFVPVQVIAQPSLNEQLLQDSLNGSVEQVQQDLANGANPNAKTDRAAITALMEAAENDHAGVIRVLFDHGADNVDARDADGETALMYASGGFGTKAVDTVLVLLEHGASVNAKDSDGNTALDCAVSADVIGVLRSHGAQHGAQGEC